MAGIKDRLIQFILRGKDDLSPEARKAAKALEDVQSQSQSLRDEFDRAKSARGLAETLKQTQRAAEQAEQALVQNDLQVRELREALNKAPEAAGLAQSLKEAEREGRKLAKQVTALNASLSDHEAAARDAGIDTADLANEEKRLAAELAKAKAAVGDNTDEVRRLENELRKASRASSEYRSRVDAARDAMASGTRRVLAFAAAYISLNAAFGLVQKGLNLVRDGIYSMLETGDRFEGMQTQLTALMGSIEGGEQATEWIKRFTRDTPLQLQDVTEAFTLLKAFGLDPMDGTLQAITDQSEKLGGGMEKLTGISSALGQAWAKQKLQGEEILQLVERGVPVWDLLQKVTGKNAEQLQELSSKGKLGRDVIRDLITEIGKAAEGSAAANMSRLTGIVSNLRDVAADFLDRIAKSGALDYVKQQLLGVADAIDQMDKDGRLDALAESLSNAFVQGSEKVREFVQELAQVDFNKLIDDSARWFNSFGEHIDTAVGQIETVLRPARTGVNVVTAFFAAWVTGLSFALSKSLAAVGVLANVIPDALGGEKLRAGIASAREALEGLTDGAAAQFGQDMRDIGNTWSSNVDDMAEKSERAQQRMAEAGAKAAEQLRQQFSIASEGMDEFFRRNIASIDNALAAISFTDTLDGLEQVGVALQQAFSRGDLSDGELAAALQALSDRKIELGDASEKAARASRDLAEAVETEKTKQWEARAAYDAKLITLEEYQRRHNAAAQALVELARSAELAGTAEDSLSRKVEEQRKIQATARAEYDAKLITLEEYQKQHNAAAAEIERLANASTDAAAAEGEHRKSIADLREEQRALLEQYRKGDIALEEFQARHNAISQEIAKLGGEATETAKSFADLVDELEDFTGVQQAISKAKTDVDISSLRAAITKLYKEGKITAEQYAKAISGLEKQQDTLNASTKEQVTWQERLEKQLKDTSDALDAQAAKEDEADKARKEKQAVFRNSFSTFFDEVMTAARSPLAELSEKALEAFDALKGISSVDIDLDTSTLENTAASLAIVNDHLADLEGNLADQFRGPFARWADETLAASRLIQRQFLEQKQTVQALMQEYDAGGNDLQDFAAKATKARRELELLEDSDLQQLDAAIAGAQQRMQELGNSSRTTLDSLRDELDRLQGNTEAIERRRLESRQRELQAQMAEAQAAGNEEAVRNLAEAMTLLQSITDETRRASRNAAGPATAPTAATAPETAAATPSKIIRLESAQGRSVDVSVPTGQEDALLGILEQAGLRSV